MSSLIDDIATYLQVQGVGTIGTTIIKSWKPDIANDAVFVLDTGGMQPDHYIPFREPTIQIFIRSSTYSAGKLKLDAVRSALHNKYNLELVSGGTTCLFIQALAEGGHLGRNERGLDEFSINFHLRTR